MNFKTVRGVDPQYVPQPDKPFLIMVEGPSDQAMLREMLRTFALDLPAYQIMSYNGKDNFGNVLKNVVRQPDFAKVTHLAVFRDADNNAQDAFRSVQGHLRNNGNEIPSGSIPQSIAQVVAGAAGLKTGVFILPDGQASGALEELLLSSLDEGLQSHIFQYVAQAEGYLGANALENYKNSGKSNSYAYSALFEIENFRGSFHNRIAAWNWNHVAFQPVREFFRGFERD